MADNHGLPPGLDEIDAAARRAFADLPATMKDIFRDVIIVVEDCAGDAVLADLGLNDPLELTGLYEGVDRLSASVSDPAPAPARVTLYRLAILFEWIERTDTPLDALVAHVLIHELGHHVGFSDDDMHAIEGRE